MAKAPSGKGSSRRETWTPAKATVKPASTVLARSVGSHLPRLTRAAFQRFGFPTADLVTDWRTIVGPEIAAWTRPERVRWPTTPRDQEEPAAAGEDRRRGGATLVLRVEGARALEVQFKTGLILERLNAHLGCRAITEIRIVQGPIGSTTTGERLSSVGPSARGRAPAEAEAVEGISDPRLAAALGRLASGVRARNRK